MEKWRTQVDYRRTRIGYWEWVVTKLRPAEPESGEAPVLADAEKKEVEELEAEDPGNQGS